MTPCYGQAIRTFVSSNGSDGNDCSRQAPCRSFATAITKTAAGGEINTLDPGGYGPVTITKSVSIVSGLGEAGVLVSAGGTGITINAGPDDQVNLRGLAIEGAGVGKTAVRFNSGGSLTMTNCVIRNLADNAIDFEPTGVSYLTITDTLIADNARAGIYLYPQGAAAANGVLSRVTITHNQWGIYANGNLSTSGTAVDVAIADSTVSVNTKGVGIGILLDAPASNSNSVQLQMKDAVVNKNKTGVAFLRGGKLFMSRSMVIRNDTAYTCDTGATVYTYGDNPSTVAVCKFDVSPF